MSSRKSDAEVRFFGAADQRLAEARVRGQEVALLYKTILLGSRRRLSEVGHERPISCDARARSHEAFSQSRRMDETTINRQRSASDESSPVSRSQILSDVLRVVSHPRFAEATFKHSCAIERRSNRMTFTIEINGGVEQERPLWWRQLLMRYIRHVTQCEGSAFICDGNQLASTALVGADKLLLEALEREMEAEGVWPKDANQLDIVLSTL